MPADLKRARQLFESKAWSDAREAFRAVGAAGPLGLEDAWRLFWATSLSGRDAESFVVLERIYEQEHEHQPAKAARAAFWLGFRLLHLGEVSRGNGWIARAEKALERLSGPCVEAGYLQLQRVRELFYAGDYDGAFRAATRAVEVAERFGDADLACFAVNLQGRSKVRAGDVATGLKLHDQAMLAVTQGELSATITGLVYCMAIDSCWAVFDYGRMREWTASLQGWCDAQPQLSPFAGECLVHRAEILQHAGQWAEALAEARLAAEHMLARYGERAAGSARYLQAELHRLRGELDAAEALYRDASQAGYDPQPGLSLLRLLQGKPDVAVQGLRRALLAQSQPFLRIKLLIGQVEVALSSRAVTEAEAAAAELWQRAEQVGTPLLEAYARDARGRVALARGEPQAALRDLRQAFEIWQQLGLPYHAARTRVQLACACRALDDEDGAMLEIAAARTAFERLGATPDVAAIDALLAPARKPSASHGLTARELEVLRLVAAGKTNKLIAAELCLSEKTVDRHVSNIFTKLNVPSRAAATAFAYEKQLI